MPVELKYKEPVKPVPIAQTPEFKKLQDLIDTAKVSLDDVARQIVAVEAKLKPSTGKPGEDAMAQSQAAQSTTPDDVPIPMAQRGFEPDPAGQTFEESIAEMRRIAGIK
jgi:hypothetical protein